MEAYLELATSATLRLGKLPRSVAPKDLRPESPIKAIRAKCVDCSGGSMAEARLCALTHCPLWAFRMGHNPFYGKSDA
jgi:hypothetical protein